ncbi:type III-B CRISPR module RAMP protein Cmr4 [Candidatus Synechococcus calcipolaris G9]|uniref:Type III-B CRISPR module RAMP protein Cmr4 n=1 Tax=Candidatus Synechococcus calcipolaris G9 TaxID=1497997 RepID=A0ABT6EZR5_9SYNE|nr:type III-B CRISPR module RAMP protein Cmr4 [Candidatus Synechococcus calcipolaris]MDG2991066.1 type III-B CRISPR module RAMP protein Cmr4 [Candidatus Synechococcus calcipolaris G9]
MTNINLVYFYLLTPLHTGGTTQEGNLLGIARESHTDLPYVPSSSIRGRLRSMTDSGIRNQLWGNTIGDVTGGSEENLTQGALWIGDGSILWLPVPSLSHGVVWISSPMLLQRWKRLQGESITVPDYSTNLKKGKPIYLKDAIIKETELREWSNWKSCIPESSETKGIQRVLVLPDQHCATLIQMSLWRQVKIKLDEHKTVDGGFRYEEAVPPDTLMYFPWGITSQANGNASSAKVDFENLLSEHEILQIGGQESLGRGFVQTWLASN